nr:unnamed protein product [Callosobruchus chinensis]
MQFREGKSDLSVTRP